MAASATIFIHGGIEFGAAYQAMGEMDNLLNNIRFVSEYFMKTHPRENEYYGQVGDGDIDHALFHRPEKFNDMCRPAFKCTPTSPCTEPAADTASALAAASVLFHNAGETAFASQLYQKAQSLAIFADTYRAKYSESIGDVGTFYNSYSGYYDELVNMWSWLAKAE